MKNWLNLMKLSTEYDRRARLAPALASFLPLLPLILALGGDLQEWGLLLGGTTGVCALGAFMLANFASAMGNRLQEQLWPDWPFDAPTHVRLMPDNPNTSPQQRILWYAKIEQVSGLDVQAEVDRGDHAAIRATINDAVERLRNRFREGDSQARHDEESIRYGSARNFAGMRSLWLSVSVLSCAGTWAAYGWADSNVVWPIVASILPVPFFIIAYRVLPTFVRVRARYYCEVFFQLLEEE